MHSEESHYSLFDQSDRGFEFKNALMKELNAVLGIQQRFSMALRPCELGAMNVFTKRSKRRLDHWLESLARQKTGPIGWLWPNMS